MPSRGCTLSCPPSGEPIAHGTPTSAGPGVRVLLRPLRNVVPIGWIGGRYTTSKPIAAIAGNRRAAVRKLPCGSSAVPSERGKNSYQAPYSARSRSTSNGNVSEAVTSSRNGCAASTASTSGVNAAARRVATGSVSSRITSAAASTAARPAPAGTPAATRCMRSAPSSRTRPTSMPAGTLMRAWWRQVATGSLQASTR